MKHIHFTPTPLTRIKGGTIPDIHGDLLIKRDDLLYESGGGSKARMLQYILTPENTKDIDVVVTAGGPLSNFNRACALHCASLGIKMHLVCYTDNPNEFDYSLNYFLVKLSNVKISICAKTDVSYTINEIMKSYHRANIKAKNIYGGGRCLEGIYSYYEAIKELSEQLEEGDYPEVIFVACGTGTTTSGLSAGCRDFLPNTKIHAISVARNRDIEMPIIMENLNKMNEHFSTNRFDGSNIIYHDDFLLDGYGRTNEKLNASIKQVLSNTGIMLDPVYSGKAFYGMSKILNDGLTSNKILFWHTGAVYTLLSERHLLNI